MTVHKVLVRHVSCHVRHATSCTSRHTTPHNITSRNVTATRRRSTSAPFQVLAGAHVVIASQVRSSTDRRSLQVRSQGEVSGEALRWGLRWAFRWASQVRSHELEVSPDLKILMFFFNFYFNVLLCIKFIFLNIFDCAMCKLCDVYNLIIVCKLKLYLNSKIDNCSLANLKWAG